MPIKILMPALSPTMTEGTLARWLKNEGDVVKSGDVVAEIETDKAVMEMEAVDDGVLGAVLVPAGSTRIPVNQPIAILLVDGEDSTALKTVAPSSVPVSFPVVIPSSTVTNSPTVTNSSAAGHSSAVIPSSVATNSSTVTAASNVYDLSRDGDRVFVSPLARRMALAAGLNLMEISGRGPHGRIVKADVEAAIAAGSSDSAAKKCAKDTKVTHKTTQPDSVSNNPIFYGVPSYEIEPHTSMRSTIARRLTQSFQTVPHFYVSMDIGLDPLLKIRAELNDRSCGQYRLSVNDFVVRAVALALARMPTVNSAWSEDGLLRFTSVDVAVAVAIPGGLVTPIIRDAHHKGLRQISTEIKDLADRARSGKLKPEEYQGGSFTVSNLGMYGVKTFSAIINPPQAAILAVGAGEERAVIRNGVVAVATQMMMTMSVDHRVIDGAMGAEFLKLLKGLIEDPLEMLL